MKILITGSSGLIGSALIPYLQEQGHEIVRLVRRRPDPGAAEVGWNPDTGTIDANALTGIEGAVNLAGENLGAKRWTATQKQRIHDSRVNGTRLLTEAMARLEPRPQVLASASGLGYYGDKGDQLLRENAPAGTDFPATFTREWEEVSQAVSETGIRVVNMRFGLVLAPGADLITWMLLPFKLGLGAKLGNGRQYMSWIAIDDLVRAINHILTTPALEGSLNVSSPNPVTNAEFTKTMGRVLSRPTFLTVPTLAMKLAFGEMGESLMVSVRMNPSKLVSSGFRFEHPELEGALRQALRKS
jgi:uncharacterized protein (TIGR01777 family)